MDERGGGGEEAGGKMQLIDLVWRRATHTCITRTAGAHPSLEGSSHGEKPEREAGCRRRTRKKKENKWLSFVMELRRKNDEW